MNRNCCLSAAAGLLLVVSLTSAEERNGDANMAPLFADDAVLSITIDAPFTALMEERPDKAYLKGRLTYTESDGTEKQLALKLRTRGNYRRDPEHCSFAPILLNLKKGDVFGTLFEGQNKLKLVTHCRNHAPGYEQNLLREYLAYRLLQELTDISYSTRLLHVTYVDTAGGKPLVRYGFVIEDDKAVAERNGLRKMKIRRLRAEDLDPQRQNLLNVFQYMIGNTEYSLVNPEPDRNCCHNSDVLSAGNGPPYTSLLFDFDFAGLVNAPYAEPNPRYPIPDVRQRFYRGRCDANELLPETLQIFRDKKDAFYRVVDQLEPATKRTKNNVRSYLDGFYDIISDPKRVRERLVEKCYVPPEGIGQLVPRVVNMRAQSGRTRGYPATQPWASGDTQ